ncbi:hypothetical protein LZ32DRAFT_598598 [Colletotrichum eremochloae]|nr:hypothetical protein LZ32DRAFT_598598 [Colletotrichum eremochloae]
MRLFHRPKSLRLDAIAAISSASRVGRLTASPVRGLLRGTAATRSRSLSRPQVFCVSRSSRKFVSARSFSLAVRRAAWAGPHARAEEEGSLQAST